MAKTTEESKAYQRQWYAANKERVAAQRKEQYARDREKFQREYLARKAELAADPEAAAADRQATQAVNKRYYARHTEACKARVGKYRAANPEKCKLAQKRAEKAKPENARARNRRYAVNNPEKVRSGRRGMIFAPGQTIAGMRAAQGDKCAICLNELPKTGRHVHVDHCHETGRVRAILCRGCNLGLGDFSDNPARMRAAADYVETHREAHAESARLPITSSSE